jgi:CyaY protein
MTEQQFLDECERILVAIEDGLDAADLDVDAQRSGNLLTVEFADKSKIIVNGNTPVREIWIAARSGGFHYRKLSDRWVDGRSGDELFAALSALVSAQCGEPVILTQNT